MWKTIDDLALSDIEFLRVLSPTGSVLYTASDCELRAMHSHLESLYTGRVTYAFAEKIFLMFLLISEADNERA